jgi:hypothetical protein
MFSFFRRRLALVISGREYETGKGTIPVPGMSAIKETSPKSLGP